MAEMAGHDREPWDGWLRQCRHFAELASLMLSTTVCDPTGRRDSRNEWLWNYRSDKAATANFGCVGRLLMRLSIDYWSREVEGPLNLDWCEPF